MKKRSIAWMFLLVALPHTSMSASMLTLVSPSTIASQPLTFRVEHESYQDGTVRFQVVVTPGSEAISPNRQGGFVLWKAPIDGPPGRVGSMLERPGKVVSCLVLERECEGEVCYGFSVDREALEGAAFTFYNYDPGSMPAFDGFEFPLWRFASD